MSILNSIKKTLEYSEKYGGKLTKKQLLERLIGDKIYKIEQVDKFYKTADFKENIFLKEKIKKAEKLAKLIENKFGDILFMGITGSVAAGYPKKNNDIDLIIITKINKLWINRLKIRFFVIKNKIAHRKFGQKEKKDDFCFNLWLDEKSLQIKKGKQNLKNAVDLILIRPLINKNKTYEKFIIANDWAKKWVATGYFEKTKDLRFMIYDLGIKQNWGDVFINWLMFWPQFWYMKKRIKNEEIGLHEAFFHH